MSLPIIGAAVTSALSIGSSLSRNAAIESAAARNQRGTQLYLDQQRDVATNELFNKALDINNQIGAELTSLGFEERRATAQAVTQTTERNIYGATAARLQDQAKVSAATLRDNIIQQGEAAMAGIQIGLANSKYQYESQSAQNMQNYNNALSQRQSAFEIATQAVSAGIQGASAGYQLSK